MYRSAIHDNLQWVGEHHPEILKEYRGLYIAVIERKVVDSDKDFGEIAKRVLAKYGDRDIAIPRITEEYPERVFIPSVWVVSDLEEVGES